MHSKQLLAARPGGLEVQATMGPGPARAAAEAEAVQGVVPEAALELLEAEGSTCRNKGYEKSSRTVSQGCLRSLLAAWLKSHKAYALHLNILCLSTGSGPGAMLALRSSLSEV